MTPNKVNICNNFNSYSFHMVTQTDNNLLLILNITLLFINLLQLDLRLYKSS
jgi:hypothetical protein